MNGSDAQRMAAARAATTGGRDAAFEFRYAAGMIYRRLLLACFVFGGLVTMPVAGSSSAWAQSPTFVPGTGIGLVPPKGMVTSKTFAGFEDAGSGSSILVTELPAEAYAQLSTTFTPDALAPTGVQASGPATDLKIANGQVGRLIRGKQTAGGTEFRKWVLLAKGPATTAMISVQVPQAKAASFSDAAVEAALKSVSLKAPPSLEDQISALPFRVGDRQDFRAVRVLGGSGLLLTLGPNDVIKDASQPVVIVANAISGLNVDDAKERDAVAAQAFVSIAGISDAMVVKKDTTEKDGVFWSRIEGSGTYRESMEAVSTLQIMRFGKTGYLRVVAIMRSLERDRLIPRVDALAASLSPK